MSNTSTTPMSGYHQIFVDGTKGSAAPAWLDDELKKRWDFAPDDPIELLTVSENATFTVTTERGCYVLRLTRPMGYVATTALVASELNWLQAISRDTEVNVPIPLPARSGRLVEEITDPWGQRWVATVMTRVPGELLTATSTSPAHYRSLGVAAAQLHEHSRRWQRPREFTRLTWRLDDIVGHHARWGSWHRAPLTRTTERALDRLEERALSDIDRLVERGASTWGLIHADMHEGNLIADGSTLYIIDFDDCGFGYYLFDFGGAMGMTEHRDDAPARATAWMQGYESITKLSDDDRRAACAFSALRRLASLGWLATHTSKAYNGPDSVTDYLEQTLAIADRFEQSPTWLLSDGHTTSPHATQPDDDKDNRNMAHRAEDVTTTPSASTQEDCTGGRSLLERRRDVLGPHALLMYRNPIHFVKGRGTHLWDAEGNVYLDAYNNVPSVGHAHPRIVEAISRQVGQLNTHTRYLHDPVVDYAERLLLRLPDSINRISFQCTGSEANDLAIRIAQHATGAKGVIVTRYAYHGNSALVSSVSPYYEDVVSNSFVRTVHPPLPGCVDQFHADVAAAIEDLELHGVGVAALLVDPSFSNDGIIAGSPMILGPAIDAVHCAGGLFISDEVQSGLARVGAPFWGFADHGATPDIVTMGKPMAAGLPIGVMASRAALFDPYFATYKYFNTFGGNPVTMAAGLAVLDVVDDESLASNAQEMGDMLRTEIRSLAQRYERIAAVRGPGLAIGVELRDSAGGPDSTLAATVNESLRERRVLIGLTGRDANVLKIRPPLPFSRVDAEQFLTAFDAVMRDVHSGRN